MPIKPKTKKSSLGGKNKHVQQKQLSGKRREMLSQDDQIEQLILQGFNHLEIAQMMNMGDRTVETRIDGIRKRNLKNNESQANLKKKATTMEYLRRFQYAAKQLWVLKSNAKKDIDKIRAVESAMSAWDREIRILQSLGYMPKEPQAGDEKTPMVVMFKGMPRPDRTKQLKLQQNNP